ncbi:MAG: hypothetical protein N3J91_08115 [Verrucomicrobiae bacterium]|nr:hypothetical protein [Verrucomicrobiae bacterium]
MKTVILGCVIFALGCVTGTHKSQAAESARVGQRPYEMEWAGRHEDHVPPLVDFEDLSGWQVHTQQAAAVFIRSREQQLWGQYVGRLTYRATGEQPEIKLQPAKPIAISGPFDAVTLWCYGNNWAFAPDPHTPPVTLTVVFRNRQQQEVRVSLGSVHWREWHLMHRRLTPEQVAALKSGASFEGLLITQGRNAQERTLYFDNLAVYTEAFPPLTFSPRPRRNLELFPGQSPGVNTGPGTLPFPTRAETLLPPNVTKSFQTSVMQQGREFVLRYAGADGRLEYRLTPQTGTWSDWRVVWQPAATGLKVEFRPCVEGGVYVRTQQGERLPQKLIHRETRLMDDRVESLWEAYTDNGPQMLTYCYRLWNKSLVMDVLAPGGWVREVRWGKAEGLDNPRLVTNPYYPAEGKHPAVVVSGPAERPLFLTGHVDWYRSNGSILWANSSANKQGVTYHAGIRYRPRTDGRLNDCFERFFLTVTPHYEETLPVIANPASPWKHITGTRLWYAYGATDRQRDAEFWRNVHRWGMTDLIITDHETMWRDGGESFTFRTRPAPGKGGEAGQYAYARLMQDELGFVYGPYNNFTDFSPVNEYWHADLVSRTSDNQWQTAWPRCYAPKPARAVEFCERLSPLIQRQFKFSTAYCDVHTAVAPWSRVDYDARVPGAGTMASVFYAYGEIMLLQKAAWQGPVYSEGGFHAFYMGLTDGNYAQDQAYRPAENPWLVDFDLRRLHDLGCNFGMGNTEMFYPGQKRPRPGTPEMEAWLDRFMAATVAFGHSGFLCFDDGLRSALRNYYLLLPLHRRYCLTNVAEIRYVDERGRLWDTTAAVARGVYRRSQVALRYADGTCTVANGSTTERMQARLWGRDVDLPPNGFGGWTADGQVEMWSTDFGGHRHDYAVAPTHMFIDGRGQFLRRPLAAGNGAGICRKLPNQNYEILLFEGAECGFALPPVEAVALDQQRRELGPAEVRLARGLRYVVPVQGAFSYLLRPAKAGKNEVVLTCERERVVPGEVVTVRGRKTHQVSIPAAAQPGQRLWIEREGGWIDFTVVPLAGASVVVKEQALEVTFQSHLAKAADFEVEAAQARKTVRLQPGQAACVNLALPLPSQEDAQFLELKWSAQGLTQKQELGLVCHLEPKLLQLLSQPSGSGVAMRGQPEKEDFGSTGALVEKRVTACGEVTRHGWFVHPPYLGGVGYTWLRFGPLAMPQHPEGVALRAWVGKANGSDLGDGLEYRVVLVDDQGRRVVAGRKTIGRHEWQRLEVDLTQWQGRQVVVQLETDVGPKDNSSGDWGCWAEVHLETLRPVWYYSLAADPALCRKEPSPLPLAGLSLDKLRSARRGWLHFEGRGVEGPGPYVMYGRLNGRPIGELPGAYAREEKGAFGPARMELPASVLTTLGRRNRLAIQNPNHDHFAVRRFWLEVELADGRRCASSVATATFTQPPGWPTAEGILVPFEQEITVDLWFEVGP